MSHLALPTVGPVTNKPRSLPDSAALLDRIDRLLEDDNPHEALGLLSQTDTPWLRNARGVCLLRLDRVGQAIDALRDLVFDPTGFAFRADANPVCQANYATALLLDGNTDGFFSVLGAIRDRNHAAVARLDDAIRRWKAGMTFWQRVASILGIGGPRLTLDFQPGDLYRADE